MKNTLIGSILFVWFILGCDPLATDTEYTVNDPTNANSTWRSERPLAYDEVIQIGKCPIPLPKEAINIQYVDFYAGFGGFQKYVRFEAPVEICRSQAKIILSKYNSRKHREKIKVELVPKKTTPQDCERIAYYATRGEPFSQAHWFDTDKIINGEIWGLNTSHIPSVVIDIDRGVFYYQYSD